MPCEYHESGRCRVVPKGEGAECFFDQDDGLREWRHCAWYWAAWYWRALKSRRQFRQRVRRLGHRVDDRAMAWPDPPARKR